MPTAVNRSAGPIMKDAFQKDGQPLRVQWRDHRHAAMTRRGFAVKVMRDETDRRTADEQLKSSLNEKEALLKEIHHRVKNNLQVITSLLSLQSSAVEDQNVREMFDEACNRVRSIGDIHELLYRSPDLAHVDFDTYLHQLAQNLLSFYRVDPNRIRLQIPSNMDLPLSQAIPCGLIVNELLTNSLNHGFPEPKSGDIRVLLSCEGEECLLEVTDNGIGFPKEFTLGQASSLGLQLVSVSSCNWAANCDWRRRRVHA